MYRNYYKYDNDYDDDDYTIKDAIKYLLTTLKNKIIRIWMKNQ